MGKASGWFFRHEMSDLFLTMFRLFFVGMNSCADGSITCVEIVYKDEVEADLSDVTVRC